jgi:hypothetical protein
MGRSKPYAPPDSCTCRCHGYDSNPRHRHRLCQKCGQPSYRPPAQEDPSPMARTRTTPASPYSFTAASGRADVRATSDGTVELVSILAHPGTGDQIEVTLRFSPHAATTLASVLISQSQAARIMGQSQPRSGAISVTPDGSTSPLPPAAQPTAEMEIATSPRDTLIAAPPAEIPPTQPPPPRTRRTRTSRR